MTSSDRLSVRSTCCLAVAVGLVAGYLDVLFIVVKKHFWNDSRYFEAARDFPWTVPAAHAAWMALAAVLLIVSTGFRPGRLRLRAVAWLLATLALWGAFLRLPLHEGSSFALAAGVALAVEGLVAAWLRRPRWVRLGLAGLVAPLILLAGATNGRALLREARIEAALPAPAENARNVLLIVWDTVRSNNLSLYGYPRNTTPNLQRWAREGVSYSLALAPAPWTLPSHGCFFTGRWPYQNGTLHRPTLADPDPTIAEHLAARGYQTVAFSGNTSMCSYETDLDRGFARFEDYPLTFQRFLAGTVPGRLLLTYGLHRGEPHARKWLLTQSRDARGLTDRFLGWLDDRPADRPFYAFLNYFDAHSPYIAPADFAGRLGITPQSRDDQKLLFNFYFGNKHFMSGRDILMARDAYDDCIAYLDDQLGRLLDDLRGRGLLEDTVVIIASDHGEEFGTHNVFGHAVGLYFDQIRVPLVILDPDGPRGRMVLDPVSLRDIPATVVDRLGLAEGSPFPGHSLAGLWGLMPGDQAPAVSPVLSAYANRTAFDPAPQAGLKRRGFQLSLVADGKHYVRDGMGSEQLYDYLLDPVELNDLMVEAADESTVRPFRERLRDALRDNPASAEMEEAVIAIYRRWLEDLTAVEPPETLEAG